MADKTKKNKPLVLVTEDDLENQKYLDLILRKKYDVDFCETPDEFYECLSQKNYDLIIMDMTLGGEKSGLRLTKEIKDSHKYKHIPVVGLSAHVFSQDRLKAIEAGVDVYLTKPIENKKLIDTLKSLIN